jgi:hypothetical protein
MTRPTTARSSAPAKRRAVAAESFRTAADCIGDVEPGMSLFAITRGQFSMIDAVLHVLDAVGPARLSLWTWTIADYELDVFRALMGDGRVTDGRLVIDFSARKRNAGILADWRTAFGRNSIRTVVNHAKIATVEGNGLRVLLRGSMNLNFNPRFEQLDITEGGPDFDLVRQIEDEIPVLPPDAGWMESCRASKTHDAFDQATLDLFGGLKTWAK